MVSVVDERAIDYYLRPLNDERHTDALHMRTPMKHSHLDMSIDSNSDATCSGWPIDLMSPSAMDSCSAN